MQEQVTLLHTEAQQSSARGATSGLPIDLIQESAERLRVLALLYAFIFFMAGVFPAMMTAEERAHFFGSVLLWGPSVIGIGLAIIVALVIRRVSLPTAMNLGVAFEIVSSYAIAAAEFADPSMLASHREHMGLSWVSVWVLLFTVVVPTSPLRAVLAALASVSSVGVVIGLVMAFGDTSVRVTPLEFFFALVFPYILVVSMAYVGARVVYRLGTEVKRARELGSYFLEEKLGQGGMGEVWRARHRMLARPAAIKLIRPSLAHPHAGASDEAVQRFTREAQVIARLRSPHTVELFDFGVAANGAFYYVMELLDGLDTDSLLRRFGPTPPERAIYVLRQVCHSLSEAHSCSLVHRDVKPANIFLCRYGEEYDFVKVLDFGIVRALRDPDDTSTLHTRKNEVHGTPAFISPEQALGTNVDARADIYATGCLAYWFLTGQFVFTAETPMGLLVHHAQTPPAPPSSRTELPIPTALEDLVMACLEKDPANRPQSARELSCRLAELQGANTWTQDRASEWWAVHQPSV